MQQAILDQLEKAKDQINKARARAREELTERRDQVSGELKERRETLKNELEERRETYKQMAEEAKHKSTGALVGAEVAVLEATRDVLSWAGKQLGPRAEFVTRGEDALNEALVALRAGHSATLPVEGFDTMTVKEAKQAMDDGGFDAASLRTLLAYEKSHKDRVTLTRDIESRLEDLTESGD